MHRITALLLAFCLHSSFAWAAPVTTYTFTGTLADSYAGQNAINGTFSLDYGTLLVPDFSFSSPIGPINTTNYTVSPLMDGSSYLNPVVYLNFSPLSQPQSFGLVLAFSGAILNATTHPSTTFAGGPLYTGPIQGLRFFYSSFSCGPACGPSGFYTPFSSGVSAVSPVPEPCGLAAVGCLLLLAFCAMQSGPRAPGYRN